MHEVDNPIGGHRGLPPARWMNTRAWKSDTIFAGRDANGLNGTYDCIMLSIPGVPALGTCPLRLSVGTIPQRGYANIG